MGIALQAIEDRRMALQGGFDAQKNQAERNRMGQFATPAKLAIDILRYAEQQLRTDERVRFMDPAIGTGSFYSALLNVFPKSRIDRALGYEIDPHCGKAALELWSDTGLEIRLEDFTKAEPPPDPQKLNLLICNPPYVRHHHIAKDEKQRLKACTHKAGGLQIGGLAGLYCYFLGLSHAWMMNGGLAGWLIPSEFMTVNYGDSVRSYLTDEVTLLHIHRFDPDDVQFSDALVSSAVVWFRKEPPPLPHEVRFTYGGSLEQPKMERLLAIETLRSDPKWTRYPMMESPKADQAPVLADFFRIKRGLATGNNRFFILPEEEIKRRALPFELFRPILPSPRYMTHDVVASDENGNPLLDRRLFLLDCQLGESEIRKKHPILWQYLEEGKAQGVDERYICRHRKPWYAQEKRPAAPFVCTYLGRNDPRSARPFRFILNDSRATAANVYLMLYPREPLARELAAQPSLRSEVWKRLNEIRPQAMLGEGRVYGGGLHKLEPRELGNVSAAAIAELLPAVQCRYGPRQCELFA